jgi:tetratricopeptide (TPR) repeat protein
MPVALLQATFQQAEALHRQGRLADAEQLYEEILRQSPNHFGALHLLGIIACQTQRTERGIHLIRGAIAADPASANAHNNLGNALFGLRRVAEALACYDTAITLEPGHARAYCNRSEALRSQERLQEALASCDKAITLDPKLAEAYCNRGNVRIDLQEPTKALLDFDKAIALRPAYAEAYCNRGAALLDLGRTDEALANVDKALTLRQNYPEAHTNRGNILSSIKRFEEAIASYDKALALQPALAEAWLGRGNALAQFKHFDEAIGAYGRAINLDNSLAEARLGRANAFVSLRRYEEALGDYDIALTLRPDREGILVSRGNVLVELKRYDEADIAYEKALGLDPRLEGAWLGRGNLFYAVKRYDEAATAYDKALEINLNLDGAWLGRGNLYRETGRYDDSISAYERALAINPDLAEAWVGCGVLHQELMQLDNAIIAYDKAISIKKDLADAYFNKALLLLLRGNYADGWRLYEWRWLARGQRQYRRQFLQPLWLGGASLVGKTLLLYGEQGFGDAIQFCRYVNVVSELGAKVILEVSQPLIDLFAGLKGAAQLVERGRHLPYFDYHCPLLSLPLAVGTTISNIPSPEAYLKADRKKHDFWRDRLGVKEKVRIGLVWSSGFHPNQPELWRADERRNIPLTDFAALRDIDAEFYSLQKGQAAGRQLSELIRENWDGPTIIDWTESLNDFGDTAALMENLDLVISVDTATVHLAGALGKPVWLLNRFDTDWRWHLDRIDSPWYSSMRLYRQTKRGEWGDVIQRLKEDLVKFQVSI